VTDPISGLIGSASGRLIAGGLLAHEEKYSASKSMGKAEPGKRQNFMAHLFVNISSMVYYHKS
jgi:hypothetical protein